jgi:hypothetical protein
LSHVRAVDGIFQVVRAFDDAEVIHVEGDVDPLRDMDIIQTELRLKDIDWVEKALEGLKKTGRSLGSNSLADKAKKEEIVSNNLVVYSPLHLIGFTGRGGEGFESSHCRSKGYPQGGLEQQRGGYNDPFHSSLRHDEKERNAR